jgi:hypothetical protein
MLNRPVHSPVPSAPEKLQIAAVFGMLGTFVGVLVVALALWLYQFQGRIQEQNESFLVLARSVEQLGENQRLAVDTLLLKGDGKRPADFNELYNKAARERDEATRRLDDLRYGNELLTRQTKALEARTAEQATKVERLEKDAKETPKLREKIASLEEDNDRKQRRLDEVDVLLKSDDLAKTVKELNSDLVRARWAAYTGWGLSALLGGALVVAFLYYRPFPEAEPEAEAADGERPTHRIL